MRRSINSLIGYRILATDGEIGEVDEFYFDDQTWGVRYLVVTTGAWYGTRKVLISPVALGLPDWESRMFPVRLTRDQVRKSPSIDMDKPVSRQHELALHTYYDWPFYWENDFSLGEIGRLLPIHPIDLGRGDAVTSNEQTVKARRQGDPHLRSTWRVTGYYIWAKDGNIGHLEDFIVEDEKWDICYLVVDTKNWLPSRKVLVAPEWIEGVSWEESKVFVGLSREAVKNSPVFDPWTPVSADYEGRLCDYYGRPAKKP